MTGTRSLKVRPHARAARLLVKARREKKLPLEKVVAETKLSAKQISALEAGDFSVFAAEVYGRGAYLTYARYLGIDQTVAERVVAEAVAAARERIPLKVFRPAAWITRMLTPGVVIIFAVAAVGLVVGGYIVWQVQSFFRLPRLTLVEPAGVIVATDELTVRGLAEAGAQVTVNGQAVLLSEGGQFEMKLILHPGVNVLRLEAQNAAERKRVLEKHLLLPRS
ncbi:MAG: helix-turn-helix domain-containing protein [Patescibacteria group bacterium]